MRPKIGWTIKYKETSTIYHNYEIFIQKVNQSKTYAIWIKDNKRKRYILNYYLPMQPKPSKTLAKKWAIKIIGNLILGIKDWQTIEDYQDSR